MTEPPIKSALKSESGHTGTVGATVGHQRRNGRRLLPLLEGLTLSRPLTRGGSNV